MEFILAILTMYAISFLIKEIDGPFGIFSLIRNKLMLNRFVGVFFYKLLECYFCVGFHSGWITYLLFNWQKEWHLNFIIIWGLAGSATGIIFNAVLMRLNNSLE